MNELQILTADLSHEESLPFFESGIRAGFPSPAGDYTEERLDLNTLVIKHRDATFYARVMGDSMVDAGIEDGDIAVIDKAVDAQDGDTVVAFIDGEFTIKELDLSRRDEGIVRLLPHNDKYPPIILSEGYELTIWGVVTFVIHRQHHQISSRSTGLS